jgi:aerobactin synthase
MNSKELWVLANQELIAKAIGELTFEQILSPIKIEESWELILASGVQYTFSGWMSTWEHLRISPATIQRSGEIATSAAQFFIDSQAETKMDDIVLANFLEEMNNTLYSDQKLILKREAHAVAELTNWDGEKLQTILNGHPKILLNKGRIGWGANALNDYSPESEKSFKLHWIAVRNSLLEGVIPNLELMDESFTPEAKAQYLNQFHIPADFTLLPVHPWQWDRFIAIQFAGAVAKGDIISYGIAGDDYRPQISLRTLSNVNRPIKMDIKLPLSILNTSCIRGLPAKSIAIGNKVSEILEKICHEDKILKAANTQILIEKAGVALVQDEFIQVKSAPYRYHEYLGAVWRTSSRLKIQKDELAIISASLFHQDCKNQSLIGAYIKLSSLSTTQWLQAYFKTVVIPLYHLQLHYGVGMVAHGQNIILILKDFAPSGMMLKDFQGDLRLLNELPANGKTYLAEVENELTRLPPNYLIHDLITGHFITVLRFISEVMQESDGFPEHDFYQILSNELSVYLSDKTVTPEQNLLSENFQRVLLNKVRFAIGYSDSPLRPLPMVGGELKNPMSPHGAK